MTDYMLIPGYYEKEINLPDKVLKDLSKYKKIALFAAVQFTNLDKIINQLKQIKIEILTTHGKRTSGKYQLLGCDCFKDSFEDKKVFDKADAILYIGDGLFHPNALLLAQISNTKKKPILLFDPLSNQIKTIDQNTISKNLTKYKSYLMKFLNAEKIGILVSTKPGQQYLKSALELKKQIDKECYLFIDDTFNFQNMENFHFVDVWVNTACPRIGFDDILNTPKPLINITDALDPEKALKKFS
tara:strand:+ start:18403 stop:19131 length:729 start_codon:yes stop_codon:yes gene_type:complete